MGPRCDRRERKIEGPLMHLQCLSWEIQLLIYRGGGRIEARDGGKRHRNRGTKGRGMNSWGNKPVRTVKA